MLNKNDPLVGAIQDVMRKNQAERDAVKAVNEKFGVQDRRVLPHEKQGEWDAAYQSVLTEGVEALDEAKLTPEHKAAITKKLKDIHGKGKVRFTKSPDGHSAHWNDGIDERTHAVRVNGKTGKVKMDSSPYVESQMEESVEALEEMSTKQKMFARIGAKVNPEDNPKTIGKDDLRAARQGHASHIGEDETPMTKMGIKKPDYAPEGETPDYAKSKEQTPNRTAKTSLPAGTMKEAMVNKIMKKLQEGSMEKTMGEFKRGTLHSGSKTGPIVKSREQAIAIGMNSEETVVGGKKDLPAGVSASPKPQTVVGGKKDLPAGVSASPKPQTVVPGKEDSNEAPTRSMTVDKSAPDRINDLGKAGVPGTGIKLSTNRESPKPAPVSAPNPQDRINAIRRPAAKSPIGANAAGQQVGAPAAAKPPIPRLRPANDTVKKAASNVKPAAQKLKAVRKQPPTGAVKSPNVAAKPVKRNRFTRYERDSAVVGPGGRLG